MREKMFVRLCTILLITSLCISAIASTAIIKAYADEGDMGIDYIGIDSEPEFDLEPAPAPKHESEPNHESDQDSKHESEPENESEPESEQDPESNPGSEQEPAPEPAPEQQHNDPLDYSLTCITPNIQFGTVRKGEQIQQKLFTIDNNGYNAFPLAWVLLDQGNAFQVDLMSQNLNLEPSQSTTFAVTPNPQTPAGKYTAYMTFYSANDVTQTHTAVVTLNVTIQEAEPYVTSVDVTPGKATIPVGKSFKFEAAVSGGYGFDPSVTWSLAGQQSVDTTVADGKVTIAENETASSIAVIATSRQDTTKSDSAIITVATVDHVVAVKADPADGGAVAGGGAVSDGGSINVSASPNNNYKFMGWYEGDNKVSENKSFTLGNITEDKVLVAKFQRNTCYVKTSVNNTNAGTVTKSASVNYGGKMTITAKAKDGYKFDSFVENKKKISSASSLELNNITEDRNIQAVFKKSKYTVNVTVAPQDTGKYEGAGEYEKDSNVKLRAKAYDGYVFAGWTINGQSVSKDEEYTVKHINNDLNVVANFMKKEAATYKITSGITNAGGAIVPSGEYTAPEGSSVTYNVAPQAGYRVAALSVDGKNIGAVSSYTFNNIKGGHTITATFELIPEAPKPATTGASTTRTSATEKKKTAKAETTVVPYNEETAAKGAVPEQNIVEEKPADTVEELDGEEYEDDTYTIAEEIVPTEETTELTGVLGKFGIDEETARMLVKDRAANPMLRQAFEDGYLQITVNNNYAQDVQETAVELYHSNPTLINFESVIMETLSEEEQMAVIKGTPISFNVDITDNTTSIDPDIKAQLQKKVGYKPLCYFDFSIIKTSNGDSTVINSTNSELEVVIPIPEQYQKPGRKFFVLRNHNGSVDVLENIGDDPASVRFKTDRFSEYAIAYEAVNVNKLILQFTIIGMISLVLAIICFLALMKHRRMQRRVRKAQRMQNA